MSENLSSFLAEYSSHLSVNEIIHTFCLAGLDIAALLARGSLSGIYGSDKHTNIQGEEQQKLDVISNDILLDYLKKNTYCAAVASEEMEHSISFRPDAELLVTFDPLDGSSNIDVNLPTGTIFSILAHPRRGSSAEDKDFLQPGTAQLAAGYLLYGSALILVLTLGFGCYFFTWDAKQQQWKAKDTPQQLPKQAKEFAINMAYAHHWEEPVKDYINHCQQGENGPFSRPYNMRWIGAMVADMHRILSRGGIFLYPHDIRKPHQAGKLRLLYELNPMSLLIEQAGGAAINGRQRILDIQPQSLHQREAAILGANDDVDWLAKRYQSFYRTMR